MSKRCLLANVGDPPATTGRIERRDRESRGDFRFGDGETTRNREGSGAWASGFGPSGIGAWGKERSAYGLLGHGRAPLERVGTCQT